MDGQERWVGGVDGGLRDNKGQHSEGMRTGMMRISGGALGGRTLRRKGTERR